MDGKFIGLHRDAAAIKPVSVMGHESNLKARKKGPSMRRGVDLDLTSVGMDGLGGIPVTRVSYNRRGGWVDLKFPHFPAFFANVPYDHFIFSDTSSPLKLSKCKKKTFFSRIFGVPEGTKNGTSGGQIKNLKTLSWKVQFFRIFPHLFALSDNFSHLKSSRIASLCYSIISRP